MEHGYQPMLNFLTRIISVLALIQISCRNLKQPSFTSAEPIIYGYISPEELQKEPWDVVILGGGPAGTGAGCASRLLGKARVLLIHQSSAPVGNIAPNQGAPSGLFSKALRDAAKTLDVSVLKSMGLSQHVIWTQVREMTQRLAAEGSHRGTFLMHDLGVHVVRGRGRLVTDMEVEIEIIDPEKSKVVVKADRIVIATGSQARQISGIPFDGVHIFDSDSISKLTKLPDTVTISGSGIIAIEFAKIFTLFGSNVTMLVRGSDPCVGLVQKGMDLDVAQELISDLSKNGVRLHTNATAVSFHVDNVADTVQIGLSDGTTIHSNIYLSAVGQIPSTKDLNLEGVGVEMTRGERIRVNEHLQTSVKNIFAAGDVIGSPALASTADVQGHAAIGHAFISYGENKEKLPVEGVTVLKAMMDALYNIRTIGYPVGVWTLPEVSYFGYTKASARKAGFADAQEAVASYSTCLRGRVFSPQGFLKLVYQESTGQVLGVHILGEDACEMIHFGMQLVQDNRTLVQIMSEPFTAVTFHELYMWAARIAVLQDFARQMIWQKVKHQRDCSASDGKDKQTLLKEIFSALDLNHNDLISGSELADALSQSGGVFGIVWTGMQLVSLLVEPYDIDKTGDLSLEEFRTMAGTLAPELPASET